MRLFTKSGIELLTTLRNKIKTILAESTAHEHKTHDSTTSRASLNAALDIANAFIDHNQLDYWKEQANLDWLAEKFVLIDNDKNTWLPEVFDRDTLQLALAVQETLNDFSKRKHLKKVAAGLVLIVGGDSLLQSLKLTLDLKIRFYQQVCLHEQALAHEKNYKEKQVRFIQQTNTMIDELIKPAKEAKADKAFFAAKKLQYDTAAAELIALLKVFPFMTMQHEMSALVLSASSEDPYQIALTKARGNRQSKIHDLLEFEAKANQTLAQHKLPLTLDFMHVHFSKTCSQHKAKQLHDKIKLFLDDAKKKTATFKTAKSPGLFSKTAPQADPVVDLHHGIDTVIKEVKKDLQSPVSQRYFDLHQAMLMAYDKAVDLKIKIVNSHNETAWTVLQKIADDFFMLTVCEMDETNDSDTLSVLKGRNAKTDKGKKDEHTAVAGASCRI